MGGKYRLRYGHIRRRRQGLSPVRSDQLVQSGNFARLRISIQEPRGGATRRGFQSGRSASVAQTQQIVLTLIITGVLWDYACGQAPRFFPDDPIQAMPAPIPVTCRSGKTSMTFWTFLPIRRDGHRMAPSRLGPSI